jgi:hypothetical protein
VLTKLVRRYERDEAVLEPLLKVLHSVTQGGKGVFACSDLFSLPGYAKTPSKIGC